MSDFEKKKPFPNYVYYDGWKRDAARMRYEARWVALVFGASVRDLVTFRGGVKNIGHNYVDVFVETLRAGPYLLGHLLAWVPPLALAWWAVRWFLSSST